MSERSEFGLRAASGEERRGPARLHRVGSRPAKGPFGSFWVHPKGTRTRSGRKPCTCSGFFARRFATLIVEAKNQSQERRSKTGLPRCRAAYFCLGKSKQNRLRRTRSAAIQPRRSPALLGRRGTQPKLAALRHGLLFDPVALRCSARSTARFEIKSHRNSDSGQQLSRSRNNHNEQQHPWKPAFAGITRSAFLGCASARRRASMETQPCVTATRDH